MTIACRQLLALGLSAWASVNLLHAHGGTYRGPGDTVPPGAGGGGNGTPGPSVPGPGNPGTGDGQPGNTGPVGPGLPGNTGPLGGPPGARTSNPFSDDLTQWNYWWEFNKDPYLNLKEHIGGGGNFTGPDEAFGERGARLAKDTLRPSGQMIREQVVPALLAALKTESNNDIVTGCMMALAKIGDVKGENGQSEFRSILQPFLRDGNQEIAETAAVALGILADDASVPTLIDLLEDSPGGRSLVDQREVNYRTRAYAAYGLALTGKRTASLELRQQIVEALFRTLESDRSRTKDVKAACVIALGLVPIDESLFEPAQSGGKEPGAGARIPKLYRRGQIEALLAYLQDREKNDQLVRAHVPCALARLCEGLSPERHAAMKQRIVPVLAAALARDAREKPEVLQSCVYALGLFGDADLDPLDQQIRKLLLDGSALRDDQAAYFSRIALAYAGSTLGSGAEPAAGVEEVRAHFLEQLGKSSKGNLRSWNALGAGVFGRRLLRANLAQAGLGAALQRGLTDAKAPKDIGAFAISLGILCDTEAARSLQKLVASTRDDEACGYVCVALGLLQAREAVADLQLLVERSSYRPALLKQSAIALGLLGDKTVVGKLVGRLSDSGTLASQAALASALGFIGDKDSIAPLVQMLQDKQKTALARGFAAVALGMVADKEPLPWNSKLAVDLNYRASTETLNQADRATGVLNIL